MAPLDRKLLRDLKRLWAQILAISLVMAAGVATVLLAIGSYRSLEETRIAYYERQRFADVFANVERAPRNISDRIERIPGVATVETRIVKSALLEIDGMRELKDYLLKERKDDIVDNVIRRLLSYGVGRELTYRDRFAVDAIYDQTEDSDFKMRDVIVSICLSDVFREETRRKQAKKD